MSNRLEDTRNMLIRHLKLRHFRVIETLNAAGSMQAAAARLHVTPAAVSKSCLEAEALLGRPLFERSAKGLKPNHLCARVIATGQRIHAELSALGADLALTPNGLEGIVRIGFQKAGLHGPLGRSATAIKMLHPRLTIVMEFGTRANLIAGLETSQFDLLAVDLLDIKSHPRFESRILDADQFFAVDRDKYLPIPALLESWDDYAERIWILPVTGMAVRTRFEALLNMRGLKLPAHVIETNSGLEFEHIDQSFDGIGLATTSLLPPLLRARIEAAGSSMPDLCCEGGLVWLKNLPLPGPVRIVRDLLIEKMTSAQEAQAGNNDRRFRLSHGKLLEAANG